MARAGELGLRRCEWKGYVAADDLLATLMDARLLVATQRPETRGLLWPSKLAVLEPLPRPLLFVGPGGCAIARGLRTRGGAGIFAPGEAEAVAAWIEENFRGDPSPPPAAIHRPGRQEGCATLERWLVSLRR